MKKTKGSLIIIMSVFLFSCASNNKETSDDTKEVSNNDISIIIQNVSENEDVAVELITVERFMEIYDLTKEDVGDFNLQAMIIHFQLTEENMNRSNWKMKMESYIKDGTDFGNNIADMVYGKGRYAVAEDDISSIKWLVMDNTNALNREMYIWDIKNRKSYFSNGDIMHDYSKAESVRNLSEEEISQMVTGLVDMNMPEWEDYYGVGPSDEGDYYWNLFVVLKNGDVLYYSGCQPELSGPEGFYEWLQEVIRVSKGE